MSFKHILVTLDGSPLAETALDYAEKIAEPGARIHLLNVAELAIARTLQTAIEVQAGALARDVNWQSSSIESEEQTIYKHAIYVKNLANRLTDKGYNVTTEVEFGSIIDTVVEIANDGFEVIVMTTHGRTGLARLLAGSVAESVLHKASCPLLLIPARALNNHERDNANFSGNNT